MAPNIKHISLHSQQQLIDFRVIRTKNNDYQTPTPVVDSASYWEWQSVPDYFSVEHIESNVIDSSATQLQQQSKSESRAENDDYWAEGNEHAVVEEKQQLPPTAAAPQEPIDSYDYWAETSYDTKSSDDYWNTQSVVTQSIVIPTTIRNSNVIEAESSLYWQEKTHGRDTTDSYWQEALPSQNYWTWNSAAKTENDNYWNWASSVSAI